MSVHVGQMVTEVVPEAEPVAAGTPQQGGGWESADRQREDATRRRRVALRTQAEGRDD